MINQGFWTHIFATPLKIIDSPLRLSLQALTGSSRRNFKWCNYPDWFIGPTISLGSQLLNPCSILIVYTNIGKQATVFSPNRKWYYGKESWGVIASLQCTGMVVSSQVPTQTNGYDCATHSLLYATPSMYTINQLSISAAINPSTPNEQLLMHQIVEIYQLLVSFINHRCSNSCCCACRLLPTNQSAVAMVAAAAATFSQLLNSCARQETLMQIVRLPSGPPDGLVTSMTRWKHVGEWWLIIRFKVDHH